MGIQKVKEKTDLTLTDRPSSSSAILSREGGATIAYDRLSGKNPGIIFLHGFRSDKNGGKALAIERFCKKRGQAFLRLDVSGHGQSSGAFEDGTIGEWTDDIVAAIDHLTDGPQIIVGSSMGGWLGLLAALARPERIAGFMGIAAAPDFVEDLIFDTLSDAEKNELAQKGSITLPSDEEGFPPPTLKAGFFEEARRHFLLRSTIPLSCPVRLIQGQKDDSVPWRRALVLVEKLLSDDVVLTLAKNGGHRLNEPQDMMRMEGVLEALLLQCECGLG